MIRSLALSALLSASFIVACSSDSTGGTGAAEPFTPTPKPKTGAVNLFIGASPTASPGAPGKAFSIAGFFLDYSGATPETVPGGYSFGGVRASECTRRASGECEVVKCKLTKDPSFQFAQAKYTSAGEITAKLSTGTELKASPSASSSNAYLGEVALTDAPGGGTTVTVTASGGDVPAFTETLTFVEPLVLKSSAAVSVAKGTDVKIEWTAGQGTVFVAGTDGDMDSDSIVSLSCRFPSAGGSGVIPGAVLGDEVVGRKLSLGVQLTGGKKTIGDYEIELNALISDNGLGGGNVQLEVK